MNKKAIANTSANTKDMSLKYPKDGEGLTSRQKIFVQIFAENEGRLTPTECARQAGYKEDRANTTSSELLNPKKYPKVVNALIRRRAEIDRTHEVKLQKHVQELARLREKSLADKSFSAAVNAEREEVLTKLKEIGLDGKFKEDKKGVVLDIQEEKSGSERLKNITPIQTEDSKRQDEV